MSIKYKLVEKVNPQNRTEKKWYAIAVTQRVASLREIAESIAAKSSLTVGDTSNSIENLTEELPIRLANGESVKLGEFGSLRLSIGSEGVVNKEDFKTNLIDKARVIFTPGKKLKDMLSNLHFEKYKSQ